jgi:predicted alpha/beta-fold hydrolase
MELPSTRREDTQKGVEEALKRDTEHRQNTAVAVGCALGGILAAWGLWEGVGWFGAALIFVFGLTVGFGAAKK